MNFPDQSHINRVRDALHSRSGNGASVMVGSGFSKNSERTNLSAKEMPAWKDLVKHFYDSLYPQDSMTRRGGKQRPATDNVRVAQEYEAAFGRSALHDALRRLVPDMAYSPGLVHQRLLILPWRDIYTTNWDTLIERTQDQVPERHYSTVTSVEEIPMAGRPRIVKLHGSFPAQFPLIVTEEDYRTYPTKFAPFVNTVQQSMMETVFLLIGFSGDDPNFLNWSGWIRDNLGASAPKIYLAGWLGLSPHRRRMLEGNNVVPIDLARHPKSEQWPDSLRHRHATEWLLHTLESGRPYDITSWPTATSRQRAELPKALQPVEEVTHGEPKSEPARQDFVSKPSPKLDNVRETIAIWRHNRLMYPGWLTMPPFNRLQMESNTDGWGRTLLLSLPAMKPVERLNAIRELVWREEILLIPMHPDFESAIQETLDSIDCQSRTVDGANAPDEDWTAIRENWRNVAAALITSARFRFDHAGFKRAVESLEPFQDEDPDFRHRIIHEKCLWAIYDRDFNSLEGLLTDWKPENCDPAWMMRKSAVLREAGNDNEAEELLNHSITAIKAMRPDDGSLADSSRESWATFVALGWEDRLALLDRLRELAPMRCDALGERQFAIESMGGGKAEEDPPPFDIHGRRGARESWSNRNPLAIAYRAVRLSEMAGLPPFVDRTLTMTVWADVLKKAAEEVADYDLGLAVRLLLRACNGDNDKTLGRILTRTKVATMPTVLAEALSESCLKALDRAIHDKVTRGSPTQRRFTVSAEVLSRLVVRLEPGPVESIFNRAVEYCQDAGLAESLVDRAVRNLLVRSWETLPVERRQCCAIGLLGTEVAGLNNIKPIMEYRWPDSGDVVKDSDVKLLRTPENEPHWQNSINLIARGLSGNATARRRAASRMIPMVHSGLLTEEESLEIASALWVEHHIGNDGLPCGTAIYDWGFLTLPEPTLGLALQRFRNKWLLVDKDATYETSKNTDEVGHNPQNVEIQLRHTGQAILVLRKRGEQLMLSLTEKTHLKHLVEHWADDPAPEIVQRDNFRVLAYQSKERIRDVVTALSPIIEDFGASPELGEKIFTKMRQLTERRIPALSLSATLAKVVPERSADIATALRVGMTSDDEELAMDAVEGVYLWLKETLNPESLVPQPPDDLVREVGIAVASRRSTVIVSALAVAEWVFREGQESHKEAIRQLVEDGLNYLAQELRYDREHENPETIPEKRLYCARLAAAMAEGGLDASPAVVHWLEMASEDPLPEVRAAIGRLTSG